MLDTTPGSATAPQIRYIRDLASKKDLNSEHLNEEQRVFLISGNLESLSKEQASKAIGLLLKLDDKPIIHEDPVVQALEDRGVRMSAYDPPTVQAVDKQGPSIRRS